MKKILILSFLFFNILVFAQKPRVEYTRFEKLTTAEKLAIDASDTNVTYFVYDTDLERFEQNYGTGWVEFSGGGAIEGVESTGTAIGGDLVVSLGDVNSENNGYRIVIDDQNEVIHFYGSALVSDLHGIGFQDASGNKSTISAPDGVLTTDRVVVLPDSNGTIATEEWVTANGGGDVFLANSQTFTGVNTFDGNTFFNRPLDVTNYLNFSAIIARNSGDFAGLTALNTSETTGSAITATTVNAPSIISQSTGTGNVYEGRNQIGTKTFTVNKEGDVVANSFIGDGSGLTGLPSSGGQVDSIVAGANVTVDATDPANPIVSATGGVDNLQYNANSPIKDIDYWAGTQAQFDAEFGVGASRPDGSLTVITDLVTTPTKHTETFGDGSTTSFAITHNLGTVDVIVQLVEVATNGIVFADTVITDANTVTVTFNTAPTTNAYKIIILR